MAHLKDLADDASVQVAWDEAGTDALDLVGARGTPRDDRTLCRLHSNDLRTGQVASSVHNRFDS